MRYVARLSGTLTETLTKRPSMTQQMNAINPMRLASVPIAL